MDAGVEVALLGPVRVRVDGELRPVPGAPQRALLARLALAAGTVVDVPELADALWGEDPPANAISNLHSYISRLRKLVGADLIAREPAGYRLRLDRDQVDVGRVERLAAEARAIGGRDPAAAVRRLAEALASWAGEPLADLADRLAFAPERTRLSERRQQLREEWFGLRLAAGEVAEVLPDLEAAAAADPLRERVQLLLMRARHQAGRTAEALAVADAYRRRLADEFGLDPGPALADLQRRLLTDDPELRPPSRVSRPGAAWRLPADRFIGREPELGRLRAAVRDQRVVTVVGPGGVGKTRLVLELLRRCDGPEPPQLVELADVTGEVAVVVAAALGLRTAPEGGVTAVADRLGSEPALLVLDNCEHLLAGVRELVTELLARCPATRVVATSRQRLGVPGERVIRLGPLPDPDQVALFCDRAALLRDDFQVNQHSHQLIAEVCRRLDGLPLAVELAAGREPVFGLAQLRDRLAAGLEVLEPARGGNRTTTVTATVEWSYRLLDPDARALLDRLAVCCGGFGPAALEHLAPAGAHNPAALLAELVDASLVGSDLSSDPPRYRLLEVVRHVAQGHLNVAELTDAHRAHADWMAVHIEAVHLQQCERSAEATASFRREAANLHQALSWLTESGLGEPAARIGIRSALVLSDEPDLTLVADLRRLAPDRLPIGTEADAVRAAAAGAAAWISGDAHAADRLLTAALEALPLGRPEQWMARFFRSVNRMFTGDVVGVEVDTELLRRDPAAPRWVVATAVCGAALVNLFAGDRAAAERWLAADQALLAALEPMDGFIAYTHGELAADPDPQRALAYFDQAYRQCHVHGHTYNREVAAIGRASVLIRLGRHSEAVTACRDLFAGLHRLGMWAQLWIAARLTAELLVALGDYRSAAALLTAADADPLAPAVFGPDRQRQARLWDQITGELDPSRLASTRAEARLAGRAGAVPLALRALDRHA